MGEYTGAGEPLDATGMRFAIVAARFNHEVTEPLSAGAEKTLHDHGAAGVSVVWVPGAFELPLVAKRLAQSGTVDAVVCIGAVIRGETAHFEYVAGECAAGLTRASLDTGVPVVFGVLTVDDRQQAFDRVGGSEGHKGEEAAATAIEMVALLRTIPASGPAKRASTGMTATRYDRIGTSYTRTRRTEPRIAARLHAALGDARRVVNVGAGTGNYEPADREVVAVEPSPTMIAQRSPVAAPVVRAVAEALPFPDASFDATLAIFTVHHWPEPERGLRELARVAPRQVFLSFDVGFDDDFWLVTDYFPEIHALDSENDAHASAGIARVLDVQTVEPVPVPHDCVDGFAACFWNRPEAYVDPDVQAGISCLAMLDPDVLRRGTEQLREDLASGAWDARHGELRTLTELDVGYRLIVAGR